MTILVTGANGFVGRHLVQTLLKSSDTQVVSIGGPNPENSTPFHESALSVGISNAHAYEVADLATPESFRSLIRRYQPDQIYHLAGIAVTHSTSYEDYEQINVRGTFHLARIVLEEMGPTCKFLFVSSSGVYGTLPIGQELFRESDPLRPASLYGASKANAEALLHTLIAKGLNARIARPFNHTGAGQRSGFLCPDIALRIMRAIRQTESNPVRIPSGRLDGVRDFLDVRDVVSAYIAIQMTGDAGSIYNVSSGVGLTVGRICNMIVSAAGDGRQVLFEESPDLVRTPDSMVGDSEWLRSSTGWHPSHTLEDALITLCASLAPAL